MLDEIVLLWGFPENRSPVFLKKHERLLTVSKINLSSPQGTYRRHYLKIILLEQYDKETDYLVQILNPNCCERIKIRVAIYVCHRRRGIFAKNLLRQNDAFSGLHLSCIRYVSYDLSLSLSSQEC